MSHWKSVAELLLRELDHELQEVPIYLFDACEPDDSTLWLEDGQLGSTSPWLDLRLASQLKRAGEWKGRGFAALIDSSCAGNWNELWGVAIHEAAHYLSGPKQVDTPEPEKAAVEIGAMLRRMVDATDYEAPPKNASGHGPDFVRAAAHLAYRAANIAKPIRPELAYFGEGYRKDVTEAKVMRSLATELPTCQSLRIREILQTTAPAEFTAIVTEQEWPQN